MSIALILPGRDSTISATSSARRTCTAVMSLTMSPQRVERSSRLVAALMRETRSSSGSSARRAASATSVSDRSSVDLTASSQPSLAAARSVDAFGGWV
jgi:hypothetical protein